LVFSQNPGRRTLAATGESGGEGDTSIGGAREGGGDGVGDLGQ
jgi:hypothetical protein